MDALFTYLRKESMCFVLLDPGIRRNDNIRSKLRGIEPSEIKLATD
jgi:hypothetical protein